MPSYHIFGKEVFSVMGDYDKPFIAYPDMVSRKEAEYV